MPYICELIKKQSGTLYVNIALAGGVSLVKMHGNPNVFTALIVER